MKKFVITLSFILIGLFGYSQVTNVAEFRIADASTAFGVNLPVGTKVYNIATGDYWVATAGVASTATLTSASASFTQLNPTTAAQDLSYDAANHEVDISGGGTSAVIPLAVDDGATEGLASFNAADFNVSSGNVAIDYANGQAATNSQPGFATAAHISAIETNTAKEANVSTSLSTGTVTSTTYGITSDGGSDDVIIQPVSATDAGVMTAAQYSKLLNIAAGAEVNLDLATEAFEEDDGTPTAHSLSHTAVTSQGCRVSLNGATLAPSDYTFTSTTITIGIPVYQYDQVVITYSY